MHGLLGENGAGKTTLLSTLGGMVRPDAGSIRVDGVEVRPRSPRHAWQLGIGLVHQHFALIDRMTVLENLTLGRRTGSGLRLDLPGVRRRAEALSRSVRLDVALDATVEQLGVGERQRAEILKVLLRDPGVLVLDEPTAVLAPAEVDGLLALLRRLADEGRAVVLVAHKLDEILSVADRVTVLRRGRTVLEATRGEVDARRLATAMVGEVEGTPVAPGAGTTPSTHAPPLAELRGVGVAGSLMGVDLEVRPGEIVGVAGVEGNGQSALARLLAGRIAADEGTVEVPRQVGFIPQDRHREGLVGSFTLTENMALGLHGDPACRRGPFLRWGALRDRTRKAMSDFRITAPGPGARAASLSGGNQQRAVVARELQSAPRLIVAENPTRGLDVAAAAFVHRTLRERVAGETAAAVVLVSTDLDEVLALSDRVVVLVRGRLVEVPRVEHTRAGIGARMLAGDER